MAHEPTRLYYEKLKEIISDYIGKRHAASVYTHLPPQLEALEIGLDVGISARCILEFSSAGIKGLTSVDSGDVDGGVNNIKEWGLNDHWTFHHMRSDEFFKNCQRKFDIIYVDGDHSYEQTKRDIDNAWKFLNEGGILIGHDYLHKHNFTANPDYGVHKAFREFMIEQGVNAIVYPPEPGLIVIQK